jgi:membrane fusion protein (multidrug efflux system)
MNMRGKLGKGLIFFLALSWGCSVLAGCSGDNSRPGARGGGGKTLIPVEAQVIRPQLLRNKINATGTLLANEEVELRSEITGRVTGVFFTEGRQVRKGELLLKINDSDLKAQLKRKELEEKQAGLEEGRKRRLLEIKGISQEEYDKTANSLHMIQADKENLMSQIEKTELKAPFDGLIGLRHVSEGGYVSPDILVATMQDIDPLKVEFSVPEKYAGRLVDGNDVIVRVGDNPETQRGKIYAVESKIDLNTRTITARAKIPNPGATLIPGSFAHVEITLDEIPDAIVIPSASVIPGISGETVFVCRNGKAKTVPITSGIRTDSSVQITRGLTANDTLIVSGLMQLGEDKAVQIKNLKSN